MVIKNLIPRDSKIMKPEDAAKLVELVEEPIKTKDVAVDSTDWEEVCQRRMELDAAYNKTVSGNVIGEALKDDELIELLLKGIAITRELGRISDTSNTLCANFKNNTLKILSYMGVYGNIELTVGYNRKEVFDIACPGLSASTTKLFEDSKFRRIYNTKNYVYQGNYYIKFLEKGDWIEEINRLYKTTNPKIAKEFYGIEI